MKLRILNSADVRRLLPVDRCIDLMRKAMLLVAQERTLQPIRTALRHPERNGLISMMPGYTADPEWLGIKVVSVYPDNFGTELGSHQGMVLLFDAVRGKPAAILDGREITAIRTAAATAVATDVLAKADAATLSILGYGEQAESHLHALTKVRSFQQIFVWGRDLRRAQAFCDSSAKHFDARFTAVQSAREAVEAADVLCTVTAAKEPFLEGAWLKEGQHLNVVGSSIPTTSEIDIDAVARCRVFADFKGSALELGGDLRRAIQAGAIDSGHVLGTVGDVIAGHLPARVSPRDITMFKSLGMVCEDLVSSGFVLAEAEQLGVGTVIDW